MVRFGDFNGRVLVRDKLEIVREGSAGLIFKFKSGDEEATWWKSRIRLLASIRAYGCRMSSEATGHVETLLGDAERSSSSMQWLASMSNIECERQLLFCQSAGPGHVYRCVPVIRQTRCQKMRSQLSSLVCSRNSKILFNGIPTAEIRYRCQFELGMSENQVISPFLALPKWFPPQANRRPPSTKGG